MDCFAARVNPGLVQSFLRSECRFRFH
jgi:hypothetical protein